MGKHSDFRISAFQVVDARQILQFKRKTVWREKRRLYSQAMAKATLEKLSSRNMNPTYHIQCSTTDN